MTGVTTHVLDTATGKPASDMQLTLYRIDENNQRVLIKTCKTNVDGRTDEPLISAESVMRSRYELVFDVEPYFQKSQPEVLAKPAFLDSICLRFAVANTQEHYHIPLLVSPYSYSTYRGS